MIADFLFCLLAGNAQPSTSNVQNETNSSLPPLIFPKEGNVTVGNGLPPAIFPKENVTVGDTPITAKTEESTEKPEGIPPLIFPKENGSIPLVQLPPLVFPDDDTKTRTNKTALDILNAVDTHNDMHILPFDSDEDYYKDSRESSDQSDEVEDVQSVDKSPQEDNLEENYK